MNRSSRLVPKLHVMDDISPNRATYVIDPVEYRPFECRRDFSISNYSRD